MPNIRQRLEQDLKRAVSRLRHLGEVVAVEERSRAIGENSPFADEVDEIQANESREIGFATRELVLSRVNRLSAALDRVTEGAYGICVECAERISPARLRAMPEVQTCVRCQDRLERFDQPRSMIHANGGHRQRNGTAGRATARELYRLQTVARALIKDGLN